MTNLNIIGGGYTGGLAGANEGIVSNCYATGTVSGGTWIGGLVGANNGSGVITCCYSHVNINANEIAGSLAGQNYQGANILNSYATGSVYVSSYNGGGLTGSNLNSTITNSYSTGSVSGTAPIGGFAVLMGSLGSCNNCFWDTLSSGLSYSEGGTGKSTANMKTQTTFTDAGWNFDTMWIMMGTNYPTLQGMPDYQQQTALRLDGSDDYAIASYSSTFNPSIFTYELWARVDGSITDFQSPFCTRFYDGNTHGINFYAAPGNHWSAWIGNGTYLWQAITGDTIKTGIWAFLTLTYDGTTARFYVNGALQDSLITTFSPNTSASLTLGCIDESGASRFFNGTIDEVRIWNVARDSAQIAADMGTVFTILPEHLVGYWHCNDGSGATTYDVVTGNAAALTNFNFTGTSGWIPSAIPVNISLPVKLTSFTSCVRNNSVALAWQTATEKNNYGFEIERKQLSLVPAGQTSVRFNKIGFVSGSGNSNSPKSYSFTDDCASGTVVYRLKQIDNDGNFTYSQEIEVTAGGTPAQFSLDQNYPNPFNPTTTIAFSIPQAGNVTLKIFDALGREVATLVNGVRSAGEFNVVFNASSLASGMYLYCLQAGSYVETKKLVLMK
ncbi:MAG TPA: hypothetical protein DCQ28_11510 [Bacteroidetes bacterium]|nr:hypothetical protein [Bacteroidota bacterium]